MKSAAIVFFKIICISNIYASYKEPNFLHKALESDSVDFGNSLNSMESGNSLLRPYSSFLESEKVVLTIWFRSISKIVISAKNREVWRLPNLDQKDEDFKRFELSFFKDRSNQYDEYVVTIDNHSRKCFFPCRQKWKVIIDRNEFRYENQTECL